jgi:hypothetical protein
MPINRKQIFIVSLLVANHLAIRIVVPSNFEWYPSFWKSVHASLLFSQLILIAFWGSLSKVKSYLRIPLTIILIICCVFMPSIWDSANSYSAASNCAKVDLNPVSGVSAGHSTDSKRFTDLLENDATASSTPDVFDVLADFFLCMIMGMLLSPALIVIVAIHCLKLAKWGFSLWKNGLTPENASKMQFSLGFLLCWMTVIALTLGMGKVSCDFFGFTWEKFTFIIRATVLCIPIGIFNAAYALILLFAMSSEKLQLKIAVISMIAIECLCCIQAFAVVKSSDAILIGNLQILILAATLLPLRWCGLLGGSRKEGADPLIPKTDAIANESA